jgi:hypothetical protein
MGPVGRRGDIPNMQIQDGWPQIDLLWYWDRLPQLNCEDKIELKVARLL